MEDPQRQLKLLTTKKTDGDTSSLLSEISTCLVMGSEVYLRRFNVSEGISVVVKILQKRLDDKTYGDTIVMSFRTLALILEHAPNSFAVGHRLHASLAHMASSAIHSALCYEWKHSHTDTSMLLEEALRVIRFVAVDDLTGNMIESILMGDLLTLCTSSDDALVTRGALETLHALCSKVIFPSEIETGILSNLMNLFGSSSSSSSSSVKDASSPIVLAVEKIVSPFLITVVEQLIENIDTAPDLWSQLELVLMCLGKLIERALLCHRKSTGRSIVTKDLVKLLFGLIIKTEQNVLLETNVRSSRLLLCEAILSSAGCCNRDLLVYAMMEWEAQVFFSKLLGQSMADASNLLEDPFGSHVASSSAKKKKRDNDHITVIAGLRLFVLACPNIPSVGFGPRPEALLPVHRWKWEDELHQPHFFSEEQCVTLECAFYRLEKTCSLLVGKRMETVDLQSLIILRSGKEKYRNIERTFIPFAHQYVDESLLRPVVPVKEAGPDASGPLFPSESKFCSVDYDVVNTNTVLSEKSFYLAETYFETLCNFASKGLGNVARLLSICACASLLHMLIINSKKKSARNLVMKNMIPICAMLDEALFYKDTLSNCIALTMIKWLFKREDEMKWFFSMTFVRCGSLQKLAALSHYAPEATEKNPRGSTGRAAVQKLSAELHRVISKKMSSRSKQVPHIEVENLVVAVKNLRECSGTPGLHDEVVDKFFKALNTEVAVTVYEAYQMQLAAAAVLYVLDGKSLKEILGQSLVYSSEGYASSWNFETTTMQSFFFSPDDDEPSFLENGIHTSENVLKHLNEQRLDFFVECGLRLSLGFQKMIRLLTSTLSFDLQLPLVECLLSSERTKCKAPTKAFQAMSEFSPYVCLCSTPDITDRRQGSGPREEQAVTSDKPTPKRTASGLNADHDKLERRGHLMASVGDIERLMRTGSASTKNTHAAPTTQSALQNIHFFMRTVEFYLHDVMTERPSSREGMVAASLLKFAQQHKNVVLPTLVYQSLSKCYNRGTLPAHISGVPAPPSYIAASISEEEKRIAFQLIEEAFERRFSLFRQYSGRGNYQETFFQLLFTEAFKSRNKKALMHLEKMICSYEESANQTVVPLVTPPLVTPPRSTRSSTSRHDNYPLSVSPETLENRSMSSQFSLSDLHRNQSYTFHLFDGVQGSTRCHCGKFTRESFHADTTDAFSIKFPPIAYREDITLLAILHSFLVKHNKLSAISELGSENDIFVSSQLTTLVVRSAAKSALRVALLPARFALPRWVNFVFSNAKFLLPLSIREKICRFIAYGARRSLLRYLRRQTHLRTGIGSTVSELARFSNHKFSVNRLNFLHDALRVLRKSADCRLPVMMEFVGDVGVGQGPTAQFYTLLSKELSKKSMNLWSRVTSGPSSSAGERDALVIPPPEGLYPSSKLCEMQYKQESNEKKMALYDRVGRVLEDAVLSTDSSSANAYYIVGMALGRAFLDGHVLPLHLSTALFTFIRWGAPPYRVVVPVAEKDRGMEFPIDLFCLTVEYAKMIDTSVAKSLQQLLQYDDDTLTSLQIPFTLPGDDNFDLIQNGQHVYVTTSNIAKYQRRVVSSLLYESVAVPIRLMVAGFAEMVPREALTMLDVHEISRVLCGELRKPTEPLWTYDEIRTVLVGDHGYQNDSPQIAMLAEVLANRLTPAEQQAFMFFATGCPRLPLGGICALGAITVVKRSDAFNHARELTNQEEEDEDDEGDEGGEENSTTSMDSVTRRTGVFTPQALTEELGTGVVDSDWALPSVNTCFRYVKLPPYPTVDLMHKKLLLSITQSGDTFELS